jgi:glyoxylase-like metal-dependent hydrolase (beta-lactamase superfamily II)
VADASRPSRPSRRDDRLPSQNAWAPYYSPTLRPATLALDLVEGATLSAGGLTARVLATPGHTPGGICLHFEKEHLLLTGDTLFAGSCGRTDFPGGSMGTLVESVKTKLFPLPDDTKVYPGHGGTTTIGDEKKFNPFLA